LNTEYSVVVENWVDPMEAVTLTSRLAYSNGLFAVVALTVYGTAPDAGGASVAESVMLPGAGATGGAPVKDRVRPSILSKDCEFWLMILIWNPVAVTLETVNVAEVEEFSCDPTYRDPKVLLTNVKPAGMVGMVTRIWVGLEAPLVSKALVNSSLITRFPVLVPPVTLTAEKVPGVARAIAIGSVTVATGTKLFVMDPKPVLLVTVALIIAPGAALREFTSTLTPVILMSCVRGAVGTDASSKDSTMLPAGLTLTEAVTVAPEAQVAATGEVAVLRLTGIEALLLHPTTNI